MSCSIGVDSVESLKTLWSLLDMFMIFGLSEVMQSYCHAIKRRMSQCRQEKYAMLIGSISQSSSERCSNQSWLNLITRTAKTRIKWADSASNLSHHLLFGSAQRSAYQACAWVCFNLNCDNARSASESVSGN